jgi:hypothetical protein
MTLVKSIEVKPAPFDKQFERMTKGQSLILEMLKNHIAENKPITREDIAECYGKAMGVKRLYEYEWVNGEFKQGFKDVDVAKCDWRKKWRSMQWFRTNLSACILKGKLVVLPVIEE